MTPLPAALGGTGLVAWRLDQDRHSADWNSGEGAFRAGGRWNSRGVRVVYCALDPSTAILEVAVHKTFRVLDTVAHVMTAADILDTSEVRVIGADMIPDPNWLRPGYPSAGQQAFGDRLLSDNVFVVIPSVVSKSSWNLMFEPNVATDAYRLRSQDHFSLDPRLRPTS